MKNKVLLFALITAALLSSFTLIRPAPADTWSVTTIAGWDNKNIVIDGKALKACFTWELNNSAFDTDGNLYVLDQLCLRKMDRDLNVTTLFGAGALDGEGNQLSLDALKGKDGICIDKNNAVYVSSNYTHTIYRIKPDKTVESFAGDDGYAGREDGNRLEAGFNGPTALCTDKAGTIYVADTYNSLVRKIAVDGKVTTLAGNGQIGDFKPGTGKAAQFLEFRAIAVDSKGNIYIPQNGRGSCVVKISPSGAATSFAGDVNALLQTGANHDGTGKAARFMRINALAVDKEDNLIIGENTRVRKVTPAGVVTTLAGSEEEKWRDAAGRKAGFARIGGLSLDEQGNIYVSDQYCIRKMTKQ